MFFKVARKKLPSALIYVFIFLVLIILMSNTGSSDSRFQITSVNICIIDKDQSMASQGLSDYLTGMHELVELDSYDNETLQDNLFYQTISYVLTIPKGFEAALTSGITDGLVQTSKRQDSASGYFVDQQVDSYLRSLSLYLTGGATLEEAIASTRNTIAEEPEVTSVFFGKKTGDGQSAMYYFFQYFPYVIIMILIEGLSPILMAFHKKDVEDRIRCSSMPSNRRNIQIGLGCATYSMGVWVIFLLISIVMYGPAHIFSANGLLCILNTLVFLLISSAITLFISTFSIKGNVLSMVSNVIGLGMSFLCGIFVPQWLLGETVLAVSRFLPAYWYIRILNMLSGFSGDPFSMHTYWSCIGVELLFLFAIFAAYLVANQQRQKSVLA